MNKARADTAFREDINGLRALAVIGVVAFHFKLGPLRAGGFAGVDVFFVISGYLMTQIITRRLDRGSFSLASFLQARVRRIVPAFVVMIIGVLAAGFMLLGPLSYEALAERAAWSLPFVSNVLFAKQGVYFLAPEQNWFLHTWSLAVEAQFYLFFPCLLVVLRRSRMPRGAEAFCLTLIALASIAIMIWSLSAGADVLTWSFYMLWSRAWEFLAGALCVYASPSMTAGPRGRRVLRYGGVATVLLAMLIFHETTPWPSWATALPVAGAAAILIADHDGAIWARVVPVRRLGFWSYSVYLWHWPIAAALGFFDHWTLGDRLLGVAASLLLGIASYALIERRMTDLVWRNPHRAWRLGVSTFGLALVFAVAGTQANGLEAVRYAFNPSVLARIREFRTARNEPSTYECDRVDRISAFLEECRFGKLDSNDVVVVGDSFAAELTPRYRASFQTIRFGLTFVTQLGCAPISDTKFIDVDSVCDKWTEDLYPYLLQSKAKRIVFVAFWPAYVQGSLCLLAEPNCGTDLDPKAYDALLDGAYRRLADLWKALREQGKQVDVFDVVPYPGRQGDPLQLAERIATGHPMTSLDISYRDFMAQHRAASLRLQAAANYAGVTVVNPAAALCPQGRCPIVKDGRPLYRDGVHLRAVAIKDPHFEVFDRFIVPSPFSLMSNK